MPPEVYEFGEFNLDVSERRLSMDGKTIPLEPKTHDVLAALVRRAGRLTTKRELLELVWPGSFVEEGILAVHISTLRKVLDGSARRKSIETVPRAGYRFTAAVTRLNEDERPPTQLRQSIAVLPARPFTGEILSGRDRSTGLAIADALIDRLGRFEELIVRPTRAVQAHLGAADPAAIGRSLRVAAVIDAHFYGTADRVRVNVDLIRSEDGAGLWSGKFDEPATGLLSLAAVVADCVAVQLGSKSRVSAGGGAAPQFVADPAIYELVGRGRLHLLSYSVFELPKAVEAFRAAIGLDPTYAPAHAGLALACCTQAALRVAAPREAYQEARAAALRALAMDNTSADAQVALGAVLFFSEWNWAGAERSLKRALQLNPNHCEAYLIYGQLLEGLGNLEQGLRMKWRALERDPFSPLVHLQISISYWHQRRYDQAIEWANKTLELDPRHPHAREHLAGAYWKKGDSDRFFAENIRHAELHGAPAALLERLKQIYAAEGQAGMRKLALERASSQPQAVPAMQLALLYAEEGDMDAAFHYLEQTIESHDPCLVHLAVAPQWDCLRGDIRFTHCLARMGLHLPSRPI